MCGVIYIGFESIEILDSLLNFIVAGLYVDFSLLNFLVYFLSSFQVYQKIFILFVIEINFAADVVETIRLHLQIPQHDV